MSLLQNRIIYVREGGAANFRGAPRYFYGCRKFTEKFFVSLFAVAEKTAAGNLIHLLELCAPVWYNLTQYNMCRGAAAAGRKNCPFYIELQEKDSILERYIAFDIGDRRIGVAVSDPFNSYALPSSTYVRTGFSRDIPALVAMIKEKGATQIVCGLPVNADGTPSVQTEKTERFICALEEATGLKIFREDERYTSLAAHEQLYEGGKRAKEHKKYVDALAAASILDSFLAKLKKQGEKS